MTDYIRTIHITSKVVTTYNYVGVYVAQEQYEKGLIKSLRVILSLSLSLSLYEFYQRASCVTVDVLSFVMSGETGIIDSRSLSQQ